MLRVPEGLTGPDGFDALSCLATGATVVSAVTLARSPEVYAATVAHVLDQLFTRLPERGDLPAPRLAVMVDEAHLLFADAPVRVARRLEQIVRLIRSKGVALVFATQAPSDLPDVILGQLASRVQHAMRSATPRDARAVRAAAETMPAPPGFDAAAAIGRLRPGEALVSLVGPDGQAQRCSVVKISLPGPVPGADRCARWPRAVMGALAAARPRQPQSPP